MDPSRAITEAVKHKKPVPEIDFSLHTMEDGTQVSTMERVVKGMGWKPICKETTGPVANACANA